MHLGHEKASKAIKPFHFFEKKIALCLFSTKISALYLKACHFWIKGLTNSGEKTNSKKKSTA
jgi:hypothetical protein